MGKIKRVQYLLILASLLTLGFAGSANATCTTGQQSCSTSYGVGQAFFGSGGSLDSTCSTSYCAKQSLGETGVGNTKSTNYQAQAGFNVNREPSLEFYVTSANVPLGVLTPSTTATGTASFMVESYLSSGYSIVSISQPPTNGSYTISALATPSSSVAGTEQFGMNLVSNTATCGAPANFGANPVEVPSSAYSFGSAASGYNTCGKFEYIPNSTIATSTQSSGETDYEISYIMNISNLTPGGAFSMNDVLVAIPTF